MAKRYENMDNVSTKKSIRSFLRWRKERKQNKKDFSFLVEQSPVKQSAFLQSNVKKNDCHMDWAFYFSYPNEWT